MRPLLLSVVAFAPFTLSQGVYVLSDDYTAGANAASFANNFDFFTVSIPGVFRDQRVLNQRQGDDPTSGYVNYLSQADAINSGLLSTLLDGSIYMGVDHTNVSTGRGRNSIRIESKKVYNHGLFIIDLAHMPEAQCGVWPAYWLKGPVAQSYSELDIIEGVNLDTTNLMSLKTSLACSIGQQPMSGTLKTTDCNLVTGGLVGCSIDSASPSTYGTTFDRQGGGVYAVEWTSDAITIYFFPRTSIPGDISAGTPQPSLWGLPLAKFQPSCRLDDAFQAQNIVLNIDFCGQYANSPFFYNQNPTCTSQAGGSCTAFVRDNPGAFTGTYWQINQLKVYQLSTASTSSSSTGTVSVSSTSFPSPQPASTTSTPTSSFSSASEASTTSNSDVIINYTPISSSTSSSGIFVFTPGLPNPSSSSTTSGASTASFTASQAYGSTSSTTSTFSIYTGLPEPPSTSILPTSSASTSSTSFSVYTGLPEPPSTNIQPSTSSTTTSTSTSGLSTLSSTAGPLVATTSSSTTQFYIPPSSSWSNGSTGSSATSPTVGPLPGSSVTSAAQYSTLSSIALTSSSTSSYATAPKEPSSVKSQHKSSSTKSPLSSAQTDVEAWGGHRILSTTITMTLTGKNNIKG